MGVLAYGKWLMGYYDDDEKGFDFEFIYDGRDECANSDGCSKIGSRSNAERHDNSNS